MVRDRGVGIIFQRVGQQRRAGLDTGQGEERTGGGRATDHGGRKREVQETGFVSRGSSVLEGEEGLGSVTEQTGDGGNDSEGDYDGDEESPNSQPVSPSQKETDQDLCSWIIVAG